MVSLLFPSCYLVIMSSVPVLYLYLLYHWWIMPYNLLFSTHAHASLCQTTQWSSEVRVHAFEYSAARQDVWLDVENLSFGMGRDNDAEARRWSLGQGRKYGVKKGSRWGRIQREWEKNDNGEMGGRAGLYNGIWWSVLWIWRWLPAGPLGRPFRIT